jgi:hypothetical protein
MSGEKMNEQLKQLARDAGLLVHNPKGVPTKLEKFAELIIQECANVVASAVDHREPASTYVNKIKQHFGVEQ